MTTTTDHYEPRDGDRVRIEGHGSGGLRGETRSFIYEGVIDRPYPDLPGWRLFGINVLTGAEVSGDWFSSDEQMNTTPGYGQITQLISAPSSADRTPHGFR